MVTYNLINLKKRIKYICCAALIFSCVLSFKVQATEDDIFSPASAKVYTAMSDDSDVAANLIVGSMFEVLGAENDANGTVWYQVRTDFGVDGYVKASELDRVLEQAQQMQQQAQPQVPTPDEGAEGDGNADDGNADDDNAGMWRILGMRITMKIRIQTAKKEVLWKAKETWMEGLLVSL